jgi:hypothetical protein
MLTIRCKNCNKELISHPTKTKCCGCSNMTTIRGENISALDLSNVIIIETNKETKKSGVLTYEDLAWQEERKKRKVRKLDFEIR